MLLEEKQEINVHSTSGAPGDVIVDLRVAYSYLRHFMFMKVCSVHKRHLLLYMTSEGGESRAGMSLEAQFKHDMFRSRTEMSSYIVKHDGTTLNPV